MNYQKLNEVLNKVITLRTETYAKANAEFDEKIKPLQEECGVETGHNFYDNRCTACGKMK